MLDSTLHRWLKPTLDRIASLLVAFNINANTLTLIGFVIGLLGAASISQGHQGWGLALILLSRLIDGLDGAVARQTQATQLGAFLDITLDFIFYASIPLAFALQLPELNALPAALLLFAFIGTGSSFLAFAIFAPPSQLSSPSKSFYFLGGLTEASETLLFFVCMCIWPEYFPVLAYCFTALCLLTVITRVSFGIKTLSSQGH
jgi:phosphatidylglycerophosphate synthase